MFHFPLINAPLIALFDCTFPIPSRCAFPAPLPLPVDAAQVDGRLTVVLSLGFKALMTDLNVQSVSFVGSILNRCPLLPPDGNVFSFIVFPVL